MHAQRLGACYGALHQLACDEEGLLLAQRQLEALVQARLELLADSATVEQ